MAYTENLDDFLDNDHGFSVEATFAGTTINGIYDDEYFEDPAGAGVGTEGSRPVFLCKQSDLDDAGGAEHSDVIVIDETTYHIAGVQPDGTGLVRLMLEEQ